jgi:hypothetical protein
MLLCNYNGGIIVRKKYLMSKKNKQGKDIFAVSKIIMVVAVVAIVAVAGVAAFLLMDGSDDEGSNSSITVIAPEGGNIQAGTTINIWWNTTGDTGDTVKIDYSYEGGPLATINVSAPNNGYSVWTIPSDLTPRSTYFVRVTSNNDWSVFGDSAIFSITAGPSNYVGTITVLSPASGSSYERGTELRIEWTHTGNIGPNLQFYWLHSGGSPTLDSEASVADQGFYGWDIPSDIAAGDDYQIRVISSSNTSIYADSGVFSISTGEPSISLSQSTTAVPYQEKVIVASISDPQDLVNLTMSLVIDGTAYNATVAAAPSFVPSLPIGYEVTFIDIAADENVSTGDYFLVTGPTPISTVTIALDLLWGPEDLDVGSVSWTNSPPSPPSVSLSKSTTAVAHQEKILVASISDPVDYANVNVSFVWNSTSIFPIAAPGNLTGTPVATGYTITFVDLANDGKLSTGDYFLITSSGGAYQVLFNLLWGSDNANIGSMEWTTF